MNQKVAFFTFISKDQKNSGVLSSFFEKNGFQQTPISDLGSQPYAYKTIFKILGTGQLFQREDERLLNYLQKTNDPARDEFFKAREERRLHLILEYRKAIELLPYLTQKIAGEVYLHLVLTTGEPADVVQEIKKVEQLLVDFPEREISTVSGAEWIFNTAHDWGKVQAAYDEIVFNQTQTSMLCSEYVEKEFEKLIEAEKEIHIEQLRPVCSVRVDPMFDSDAVLILEPDAEKTEMITKMFELSKNDERKAEFGIDKEIFIVNKPLPDLLLGTIKMPYPAYEEITLRESEDYPILSQFLAQHDIRQIYLADEERRLLLDKYFHNEKAVIQGGQKNMLYHTLLSPTGEEILTPEQHLLQIVEKELQHFEFFMFAAHDGFELSSLQQIVDLFKKEKAEMMVLDFGAGEFCTTIPLSGTSIKLSDIAPLVEKSLLLA